VSREAGGETSVEYDLTDPLAKALLLRAFLADKGWLKTDLKAAEEMSFVLARGPGGVTYPNRDERYKLHIAAWVPADVADELLAEHARRLGIHRGDDSNPEYYPSFVQNSAGIAVALLGGNEMNHTDAVNWIDRRVTCCIFGTKLQDWPNWTLISPFHVWYEPAGATNIDRDM
jgi:hypothetical protein